jgi:hypothetical protein
MKGRTFPLGNKFHPWGLGVKLRMALSHLGTEFILSEVVVFATVFTELIRVFQMKLIEILTAKKDQNKRSNNSQIWLRKRS